MENLHDITIAYFQATKNYFWQWAGGVEEIEWSKHQGIICFREEVVEVLQNMGGTLPPLSPLLLTIAIAKMRVLPQRMTKVDTNAFSDQLHYLYESEITRDTGMYAGEVLSDYIALLTSIPDLYMAGPERQQLLNVLFENVKPYADKDSNTQILAVFERRAYDGIIEHKREESLYKKFTDDINILAGILKDYPNAEALERALKAPRKIPAPAPPLPEVEPPQQQSQPESLLDQLSADVRTSHLALLTQRVIAALHLPMHTKGHGDTRIGGVADITNKGNFDKLLLSELAYENDTLLVRLANNEALYLRREELPDNKPGKRYLLIDKSIKMWGTPHMLGMATALACVIDNKQNLDINPYALSGDAYEPVQLDDKDAVIDAMQLLSPLLDSSKALHKFNSAHTFKNREDFFLITNEEQFHLPAFQQAFAALRQTDGLVATVNRQADLYLYKYSAGHRKLLSKAKINLDMPVVQPKPAEQTYAYGDYELPAFLKLHPFPLRIPQQFVHLGQGSSYFSKKHGGIAIKRHRQLLYWTDEHRAAIEITADFPDANKYFIGHGDSSFYILLQHKISMQFDLYELQPATLKLIKREVQSPDNLRTLRAYMEAAYKDGSFYVTDGSASRVIDVSNGKMTDKPDLTNSVIAEMQKTTRLESGHYKFQSYNTINNIRHIEIGKQGQLLINKQEISFTENAVQLVKANALTQDGNMHKTGVAIRLPGLRLTVTKFRWPDGSEAWFDPARHMLHLRSSDRYVPEVSIPLIVNQTTACWASDGMTCGSGYFKTGNERTISPKAFYQTYITPFIRVIQQYGTAVSTS